MATENIKTKQGERERNSVNKDKISNSDEDVTEDYFKVINCGNGKRKVFKTENDWKQIKRIVETEVGIPIDTVLQLPPKEKFSILHEASRSRFDLDTTNIYPQRICPVCDKVFRFPDSWDFVEFRDEAVCRGHTIKEAFDSVVNGGE